MTRPSRTFKAFWPSIQCIHCSENYIFLILRNCFLISFAHRDKDGRAIDKDDVRRYSEMCDNYYRTYYEEQYGSKGKKYGGGGSEGSRRHEESRRYDDGDGDDRRSSSKRRHRWVFIYHCFLEFWVIQQMLLVLWEEIRRAVSFIDLTIFILLIFFPTMGDISDLQHGSFPSNLYSLLVIFFSCHMPFFGPMTEPSISGFMFFDYHPVSAAIDFEIFP